MIYSAFIHSHLAYVIEIYGNTYTNHLNRLMILNNKLMRILQNAPRETPVVKLYANFNTFTLPELHTYQILKFIHNCIYHQNKLPSIFSNYISQNYMIHTHNTSTREHLHLEHTYSSLGQRSVKFKGSCLWNSLPDELKSVISALFSCFSVLFVCPLSICIINKYDSYVLRRPALMEYSLW